MNDVARLTPSRYDLSLDVFLSTPLRFADLIDSALVAPSGKGGVEPEREDFVGQAGGDDAPTHREHVGVVVLARQPRGEEVVAERGADAGDLVRGDLLALAAAADHDAAIGAALGHLAPDGEADRRIVDRHL